MLTVLAAELRPRRLRGSRTRSPASVARAGLCSSTADTHRSAATAPLAETMLQNRGAAGCRKCLDTGTSCRT